MAPRASVPGPCCRAPGDKDTLWPGLGRCPRGCWPGRSAWGDLTLPLRPAYGPSTGVGFTPETRGAGSPLPLGRSLGDPWDTGPSHSASCPKLPVGQDGTGLPATLNSGRVSNPGTVASPGAVLACGAATGAGGRGGWKSSFGGGDVAVCPTLGNSSAHVVAPHRASGCLLGARPQGHVHGHLLLASSGLDFIHSCIHSANIGWTPPQHGARPSAPPGT